MKWYAWYSWYMNLNIRNVPPEVMRAIKLKAVEAELSIRGYCLARLADDFIRIIIPTQPGELNGREDVVRNDARGTNQRAGHDAALPVLPKAKGSKKRLHQVPPVRDELATGGDGPTKLPEPQPGSGKIGSCPHDPKRTQAFCRLIGGGC
jgi:hypothetical protein